MILDIGNYIAWYQKKIGTYDKQQWEKSVEQKILDGLNTVTLNKTAKLKTELIDVDLVRGSTFPKAKPKQNLFTVVRLAILRYIFLPAYAPWWVKQTSPNIFALLLFLYVTQMINWALYTCNTQHAGKLLPYESNHTIAVEATISKTSTDTNYNVLPTLSDLLIPMALSFLLSLIHSQIVATNIVSGAKVKRKRFSGTNSSTTQQREPKVRRRKKMNKIRSQDTFEEKPSTLNVEDDRVGGISTCSADQIAVTCIKGHGKSCNKFVDKKRNVNWSYLHGDNIITRSSCNDLSRTSERPSCSKDDFKQKSPVNRLSPRQSISDENSVKEFVDDLIKLAVLNSNGMNSSYHIDTENLRRRRSFGTMTRGIHDDDGFESFNGKSSSGEDINPNRSTRNLFISDEMCCSSHSNQKFQAKKKRTNKFEPSSDDTDEGDDERSPSSKRFNSNFNYNECTTSATEWLGITTNSEECSYSSDLDNTTDFKGHPAADEDCYDLESIPTVILNAHGSTDKISCMIWVHDKGEFKKAQMSVLEIAHMIIDRVESMPETYDYIYIGMCFSVMLTLIPAFSRLCGAALELSNGNEINYLELPLVLWQKSSFSLRTILGYAFGNTQADRTVLIISLIQRFFLTTILFIIFAAAEKTFKQRFLFAKLFSHLTSLRRARKSNLPHFRLNKVRNIKTWLSVRSYLKKRGPQRSVDVIVSAAFLVTLFLLAFLSIEWLQDSAHMQSHLNLEALSWATTIGVFLLRYMTLGNKIHQKYRCISVLITEQINLYLQIEQKPNKKDELMVSNSVLKLAADLLKELESPFKISGLSANPYLFTTIKVVILSALSGVLSEMLGFKLKLHKIKIK